MAHNCWKLADFGSASVATSKQLNTTQLGRGTEGYRAPELLSPKGKCNNKADIFALGCVIYEIVTGDKLFENEWAILDYARTKDDSFLAGRWPKSPSDTPLHALGKLIQVLIDVTPAKRLGAKSAQTWIEKIRRGAYHEIEQRSVTCQ